MFDSFHAKISRLLAGRSVSTSPAQTVAAIAVALVAGLSLSLPAGAETSSFDGFVETHEFDVNGAYAPVPLLCDQDGDKSVSTLWYGLGSSPDSLWTGVTPGADGLDSDVHKIDVNGAYSPFAGDFDGDGCDDIFWYGEGIESDSIWYMTPDGVDQKIPVTVNGKYQPVVNHYTSDPSGDREDDAADIYWFDPSGPDRIGLGTSVRGEFETVPAPQIDGLYDPAPSAGGGILFSSPIEGEDAVVYPDLKSEALTGTPVSISGLYENYGFGGASLLYGRGGSPDQLVIGPTAPGELFVSPGKIDGSFYYGENQLSPLGVLHSPAGSDYLLTSSGFFD